VRDLSLDPRRPYLEALLAQIQLHAEVMRFHLGAQDQNATVGLAAETGVRDVLRNILPGRFAVTSGFMCDAVGRLIVPASESDVSPQTDVIVYDASRACPVYKMNEIEVVAAHDVLGFIEVKDRRDGERALRDQGKPKDGKDGEQALGGHGTVKPGALPHVARLATHAPGAFKAVVLLRGDIELKGERKTHAKAAHDQCQKQRLTSSSVPHAIYCADKNYVAVYEYTSNKLHFVDYGEQDRTSALADFLRVLTSFFAAQGLSTTSSSFGLSLSDSLPGKEPLSLKIGGRDPLPSLRDKIACFLPDAGHEREEDGQGEERKELSFERKLKQFAERCVKDFYCTPTTGRNERGEFCSGIAVVARLNGDKDGYAASFFTMTPQGLLSCVDSPPEGESKREDWLIAHERPEAYLRRICKLIPESKDPFASVDSQGRSARGEEG
jgi:hypothetical protein